jgi:hypothetical protein
MSEINMTTSQTQISYWEICADGTIDIYYANDIRTKIYLDGTEISRSSNQITAYFPDVDEAFVVPKEKTHARFYFNEIAKLDRDDITVKSFAPSGRRTIYTPTILYPDKEFKENIISILPDGTQTIYYPTGKTIIHKNDGTFVEMHPTGYVKTSHKNGFMETIFPNGNTETVFPDGTHKITLKIDPFGQDTYESIVSVSDDGSLNRLIYYNGTLKFYDDTGFIKIYDDGNVVAKIWNDAGGTTTSVYKIGTPIII